MGSEEAMNKPDFDEVTKWVKRINELSRQMDEMAMSMHPSGWKEQLGELNEKYRKLAASRPQ